MNRLVSASIEISRTSPPSPACGSRTNRSMRFGMRISAFIALPSLARDSCSAIEKPRLGMNGNGCAGSTASGVSNGNTWARKWSSSQAFSALPTSGPSTSTMPAWASAARSSRHCVCWSCTSSTTASAMRTSCSAGVSPSGLLVPMPARTCARRPATRTMKNSSRLFAEIDRNFNRSSSGWPRLADSSRTRRLKLSHDSSRLMKRSGLEARADAAWRSAGSASRDGASSASAGLDSSATAVAWPRSTITTPWSSSLTLAVLGNDSMTFTTEIRRRGLAPSSLAQRGHRDAIAAAGLGLIDQRVTAF